MKQASDNVVHDDDFFVHFRYHDDYQISIAILEVFLNESILVRLFFDNWATETGCTNFSSRIATPWLHPHHSTTMKTRVPSVRWCLQRRYRYWARPIECINVNRDCQLRIWIILKTGNRFSFVEIRAILWRNRNIYNNNNKIKNRFKWKLQEKSFWGHDGGGKDWSSVDVT